MPNRAKRKRRIRKTLKELDRQSRVLVRKVAKVLLGRGGWISLPPIGQYPVEEITESFWDGSENIIYRRNNGKA